MNMASRIEQTRKNVTAICDRVYLYEYFIDQHRTIFGKCVINRVIGSKDGIIFDATDISAHWQFHAKAEEIHLEIYKD